MSKLTIHPMCYLLILFAILNGFIYELALLFLIVIIHELGHVSVALSFGWRVTKVELLPFGGAAKMDEYGTRPPHEEFWVVIAGPLMNLAMMAWAYLLYGLNWVTGDFYYLFLEYNLIVLIFNLLPIWPLDGGKLIQLALSFIFPYQQAIRYSFWISVTFFCFYVFIVSVYYFAYFYLWLLVLFLSVAQWTQWKQKPYQFMRFLLERSKKSEASFTYPAAVIGIPLFPQERLKDGLERMFRHKHHYFCLLNQNGEVEQVISEAELLAHYFSGAGGHRAIGEVFK